MPAAAGAIQRRLFLNDLHLVSGVETSFPGFHVQRRCSRSPCCNGMSRSHLFIVRRPDDHDTEEHLRPVVGNQHRPPTGCRHSFRWRSGRNRLSRPLTRSACPVTEKAWPDPGQNKSVRKHGCCRQCREGPDHRLTVRAAGGPQTRIAASQSWHQNRFGLPFEYRESPKAAQFKLAKAPSVSPALSFASPMGAHVSLWVPTYHSHPQCYLWGTARAEPAVCSIANVSPSESPLEPLSASS